MRASRLAVKIIAIGLVVYMIGVVGTFIYYHLL